MRRVVLVVLLACGAVAIAVAGRSGGDDGAPIALPADARPARAAAYRVPVGAAVTGERLREDEPYLRRFVETYTLLTPEQSMFWSIIHPERGTWAFARSDALVDFARRAGKEVRGVLIWDQVLPPWITAGDWTRAELRRVYVDHIRTVVGRYGPRVRSWVVVNEPLEDDGRLTPSVWARVLGPDYLALAFRTARAADPDAELLLNEIAAERGPKLDALVALAAALVRQGVPVDGVGLQNHTSIDGFPTRDELLAAMRRIGDAGLDAHITEMDVVVPRGRGGAAAARAQAAAYRAAAEACAAFPRCGSFVTWGVTDRWSWKGEEQRPLPFASDGTAKPAVEAMLEPLRRR